LISHHSHRYIFYDVQRDNQTSGRPCWHRAAWRLLRKAAEMVQPERVMPTEAELQALVDELYA
jgi:hypothetical protein